MDSQRTVLNRRIQQSIPRLERLEALDGTARWKCVREALERGLAALEGSRDPKEGWVLCHGDLYPRHVLTDAWGQVTGVIDWEDLCWGDPAADLCVAYTYFSASDRPAFWEAYGEPEDRFLSRARAFAATYLTAFGAQTLDLPQDKTAEWLGERTDWPLRLPAYRRTGDAKETI